MSDLFNENCPCCGRPYERQERADFKAFWAAVPRKIAKPAAEKAWRKLTAADRDAATEAVARFYRWFEREYPTASALHPATYLNNRRWEDDAIAPKSVAASTGAMDSLRRALDSKIPAVREHAESVMRRMNR
jgi:hypothetical protein